MPNPASPSRPKPAQFPWLLLLPAISLMAGAGLTIWWGHSEPLSPEVPAASARSARVIPLPPEDGRLHSVTTGVEHGVQVFKIRVSASGDELVVDAKTGRLIEARPRHPTSPALTPGFLAP